jgi:Divergent InlB B-repeat domain
MVTATTANGNSFVHCTKGGAVVSTSASYTFTLTANVTLIADFKVARRSHSTDSPVSARGM